MEQQNTPGSLKSIGEMERDGGTPLFFLAVSHLFDRGIASFTEESYVAARRTIEENHRQAAAEKRIPYMTEEYEKELLEKTYHLSKIPLFDILLYIKKHIDIYDPEAADSELTEEDHKEA